MGRSFLLGNSGYVGRDNRDESGSTGGTGNVSVRKYFLERKQNNFIPGCRPDEPGQPTLTGILYQEDWEDFVGGNWTTVIDGDMRFVVSTADFSSGTTAGLAWNTNLETYTYLDNTDIHMYINLWVPPEVTNLTLDFDWKCNGETVGATSYDYGYVWITSSGDTPTAAPRESSSDLALRLGGDDTESGSAVYYRKYNTDYVAYAGQWNTEPTIRLTADTTQRGQSGFTVGTYVAGDWNKFVFSFTSDSTDQNQPPLGVDNIVWRYTASTAICNDPESPNKYS